MIRQIPFLELGETLSGTDDDGNLINKDKLGQIFEIPANNFGPGNFSDGSKKRLTGRSIIAVLVRNESGAALLPKRLVRFTRTAGYSLCESVDGYADTLAEKCVAIVDPDLPSAGVADDDIFWAILKGPTTILTPMAGAGFNGDISVGSQLVAATSTTTGATTAGRVSNVTMNATTGITDAFNMAANIVGKALSAKTTGNTNADLLVDACIQY